MRTYACLAIFTALATTASFGGERLSKSWKENPETNKIVYITSDVMPAGAELRIRVVEAGKAPIVILDFPENGVRTRVKVFEAPSGGQVLKFKLDRKMRVGIMVGSPASATCKGIEDKQTHHLIRYDFQSLGRFSLEVKVVGEEF